MRTRHKRLRKVTTQREHQLFDIEKKLDKLVRDARDLAKFASAAFDARERT